MIKRHSFRSTESPQEIAARLQACANGRATVEISGETVKIGRRQALALLNGFSPVFVGSLERAEAGAQLVGRFRFHLAAIGVIAGFLGLSAYHLIELATMAQVPPGYPPQWRAQRIQFELQFLGFSAVAIYVAWLAGRPARERILEVIRCAFAPPTADAEHAPRPAKRRRR